MDQKAFDDLIAEVGKLKKQTDNLEAQIYTLKAGIETACTLRDLDNDPESQGIQAWEILRMLENWSNFELPEIEIPESGQTGA